MLKGKKELYGFGPFRLDVSERRLDRDDGREVAYLPEKAFQTLVVLVRNAGSLVTKEALLSEVWRDTIVEENNLDKCIYTIRHSLGDSPSQHQYIETVRKHGYRFTAEVQAFDIPDNGVGVTGVSEERSKKDHPGIIGAPTSVTGPSGEAGFRNAFELCQQARVKYEQMTAPTTLEARELVNQALRSNPGFALAHSLSAELTTLEVIVGLKWPKEGFAEARSSIEKARELGGDSADFFVSAAYVDLIADWNFAAAEEKLRRALSRNEHFGPANRMLAEVFMFQGLHEEAARYIKRAQVETGLHNANILAISRFLARDYPGVIETCEFMLTLAPQNIIPAWTRCWALEQMGRPEEAIAGYEKILSLPYGEPALRWIGYAYAAAGDRDKALETAARLDAVSQEHNLSPTHIAAIYSALGDVDTAIPYLDKGLEMHDPFMLWVPTDPRFDKLRGKPRFGEIVASVLEKGTLGPSSDPGRITNKRPPIEMPLNVSGITESGQHLLLDITHLDNLVKKIDGRDKRRLTDGPKPDATQGAEGSGRRTPWIPVSVLLAILLVGGFIGAKLWQTEKNSPPASVTQRRLTVEGGVTRVAMSRDGRYAAAAQNAALVLFDLGNGTNRVLLPAAKDLRITSITFSPDGRELYYGARAVDQSLVTIYGLPIAGGETVKIVDNIYGAPTFSPDGKKIAFVRRHDELNQYALLTANADGSNPNELASSRLPGRFDAPPAWSPDGRMIVCSMVSLEGGFHFTIAKIDVSSGSVTIVPNQRWKSLGALSWLADSRNVIIAGQDEASVNAQVWQADSETGVTTRITNDQFVYESLNTPLDGNSIIAVKVRQNSHVWMLGDQTVQLTAGSDNYDGFNGLAWARDGTILYHSRAMGHEAIWRMRPDGTEAVEITPDAAGGFAVSPDGRLLAFQKKQSTEHLGLQVIDLETRSERPLTQNITALAPSFFPDGKRIVFTRYDEKLMIHQSALDGEPEQLLNDEFRAATSPEVSPTGRFIAFAFNKVESGNLLSGIAVIAADTKQLVSSHITKIALGSPYEKSRIQWSADESEVYFIQLENSVSNIMRLRLSDGNVSNLTNFTEGRIFNFAIEPGGRRILVARGFVERDAVLLKLNRNN